MYGHIVFANAEKGYILKNNSISKCYYYFLYLVLANFCGTYGQFIGLFAGGFVGVFAKFLFDRRKKKQ
jgi:hypothetical protein